MSKEIIEDILIKEKSDRRLLSHVPDPTNIRVGIDRRGALDESNLDIETKIFLTKMGLRYHANFDVHIFSKEKKIVVKAVDISMTGLLVETI